MTGSASDEDASFVVLLLVLPLVLLLVLLLVLSSVSVIFVCVGESVTVASVAGGPQSRAAFNPLVQSYSGGCRAYLLLL